MGEVEILHCIFTNATEAAEYEQPRARIVTLDERDTDLALPADVRTALDDLLRKTTAATTETGWVVRRFAGAADRPLVCVVVSYPDLVLGAKERAGLLNHARLAPAGEPSFDAAALVELALEFPLGDVCAVPGPQRLQKYLDGLAFEGSVLVRPAAVSEQQQLPQKVLTDVLVACLLAHGRKQHVRIAIDAGPATIARAWAALPWWLQQASSWACEVEEGCPVDVIFSRVSGVAATSAASGALLEAVHGYMRLLYEAPEAFNAILQSTSIRDVNAFAASVQKAALAPQLSSSVSLPGVKAPGVSGKNEMSKRDKTPKADSRGGRDAEVWKPLDDDVRSELDRQYRAMERSLQLAMDERLEAFKGRLEAQGVVRGAAAGADARALRRLGLYAAGLVIAAGLIAGAWAFWPGRAKPPAQQGGAADTAATQSGATQTATTGPEKRTAEVSGPASAAISRAQTSGAWPEELKVLLGDEPAFAAEAINVMSDRAAVPGAARATMLELSKRIDAREELTPADREKLRRLLVDCIAAELDSTVKIDGNVADAQRVLDDIADRFGVISTETDLTKMALQSEIILRWMAGRER